MTTLTRKQFLLGTLGLLTTALAACDSGGDEESSGDDTTGGDGDGDSGDGDGGDGDSGDGDGDAGDGDAGDGDAGDGDAGDGDAGDGDGGDGDGGDGDSGADCSAPSVDIGENHNHALEVPQADIDAGAEKTYDIQGTSGHPHSLTLSAEHFAQLAAGESVVVDSSTDANHSHPVTVSCA